MAAFLDVFSRCNRQLARWCLWFAAFGLVLMTAIIGWQVWARYVLNNSPNWSEQFCLFLMIYYILFAAAAGVRENFHIGLSFVRDWAPPPVRRIMLICINSIVAAFGVGMVWYGSQMAATTWSHVIPTLELPTGASYLPFPIAGVMFVLFSLEHLLHAILGRETV
ncbi:MAG: TRAP transporter small permease [Desulfovibrionaceae bacterium]